MRRKLVAGNWKMNGSRAMAGKLVSDISEGLAESQNLNADVVIFPPALLVETVATALGASPIMLGLQNVAEYEDGAYTGEVSAAMAVDAGCRYVLVGHSERRQLFGENGRKVAEKCAMIHAHSSLSVILCVGETLEQRESGNAEPVVCAQIAEALAALTEEQWQRTVIAYEPVWAIGTGKTASADDAQAMHLAIRNRLREMNAPADYVQILYGGSVKPDNARQLFSQPDIDGGLIGGASLEAAGFLEIIRSA